MRTLLDWIDTVNAAHPWSHNDHYVPWVLRRLPPHAQDALDVGCGTATATEAPTAPARETLREIRAAAPAAIVRRRLFWRYTLVEDATPTGGAAGPG